VEGDTEVEVVVMASKHPTRLQPAYTVDIHIDKSRPMQDRNRNRNVLPIISTPTSIYFVRVVLLFYLLVAKKVKDVLPYHHILFSSQFCNIKKWF